ncbi:hypothetical protein IEQ34_019862 [Dendrobium chrysotoxum]|uniref:Uncharacterized protein n=1 Tax=Dendrobium chrysotoxum TaxID=161865 RepID=A0AAV7GA55_DENCH|nr:hypothetical protein IEQ34_019862 [Dendrobium chrysotoxum]
MATHKFASWIVTAVLNETGALLLDGNTLNYFGKNIPINLVLAVVAEVILVGGAEYYRITNGLLVLLNAEEIIVIEFSHMRCKHQAFWSWLLYLKFFASPFLFKDLSVVFFVFLFFLFATLDYGEQRL